MMKAFKTLLVATALFQISTPETNAQNLGWNMKPITISTQWARDVKAGRPLNQYPRPQMERKKWANLNGLWEYAVNAKDVTQPANFEGQILVPYPLESALSGVKKDLKPEEVLWYKRKIERPSLKANEKLILNFGAANWEATVFINGKIMGTHSGGYTGFSFDITHALKPGSNELVVKVSNPLEEGIGPRGKQTLKPSQIFYTASSGIWQTVWMEVVPKQYIKGLKITPDVDKGIVNLVVNGSASAQLDIKVLDGKKVVAALSGLQPSLPGGERSIAIKVPNAKLWSPDDPFLYDLEVSLGKDKVKSYFGMRKVEIKRDEKGIDRIFLNNKYTYNLGTLDQGYWPEGLYTAPTDEALKFDIEAIKAMGFNTIRKHIKFEPARWYYHADKIGMLVWQDLVQPAVEFRKDPGQPSRDQFEKESKEMLAQFHNYPSITTWVLFNEGWGAYDQERLTKWVKNSDPSRLVNGHSGATIVNGKLDAGQMKEVTVKSINSDMTDVHSYPLPAIPNGLPGKARVLGEFGGLGVSVEGHSWNDLFAPIAYGDLMTPKEMVQKYSMIIDSLIKFEKQGLSASIYTQPFDVEREQNGLFTYDRRYIKLPLSEIRAMNEKVWAPQQPKNFSAKLSVEVVPDSLSASYETRLAQFRSGKKDSTFLRLLTVMAYTKKDRAVVTEVLSTYVHQLKHPTAIDNLKFIKYYVVSTKGEAFSVLYKNAARVNELLGKDESEAKTTMLIERDLIIPLISKDGWTDWDHIIKLAIEQYGDLGKEIALQSQVLYHLNKGNWNVLEQTMPMWFESYGTKRKWIDYQMLNNIAWGIFERYNNKTLLDIALLMSKRSIDLNPKEHYLIDTYANLLHKAGRTKEAIEWEKKALAREPENQEYKDNLEKMEVNAKTWKE
jgi:hypothetical protein